MTFIASAHSTQPQDQLLMDIFGELGEVMMVEEGQMAAGTSLASCGIAYALRYVRAAMEGGVELGFRAAAAKRIVMQTLRGAVDLLEATGAHPEAEIDRVTTPGGLTIRGLNAMEAAGFTHSVIEGLRASTKR
jgi:pyrroline-5-carboxylate reductase